MPFPFHFADEPDHVFLQLCGKVLGEPSINGHLPLKDVAPFTLEAIRTRRVMRGNGHGAMTQRIEFLSEQKGYIPIISYPQSTYNTCPVMAAAPSLARKVPVAPSSSGITLRFNGACAS